MSSFGASICIACGNELTHRSRSRYRRCQNCVSADRAYSLVLARHARALWSERHEFDDFDPAGRAAA